MPNQCCKRGNKNNIWNQKAADKFRRNKSNGINAEWQKLRGERSVRQVDVGKLKIKCLISLVEVELKDKKSGQAKVMKKDQSQSKGDKLKEI